MPARWERREALHEIAFAPEMLPHRIEKERKAVLAEMQQVNVET